MTHLRKQMLEELQRRNYSERTAKIYIRTVKELAGVQDKNVVICELYFLWR